MKILDLYIAKNYLKFFILVIAIPTILFSFFELLSQLDSVGRGSYSIKDAIIFIILTTPRRLVDLTPISTLLAGIAALGRMADHSELVAMEAAGMSRQRIIMSVIGACSLIMAAAVISSEYIVPPLEQNARLMRAQALSSKGVTFTRKGFWAHRKGSFIHVGRIMGENTAADIDIFTFDSRGNMEVFIHARNAAITGRDHWVLHDVTRKTIKGMEIQTARLDKFDLPSFMTQEQVSALELPPETLSSPELIDYIHALEKSGQNADPYRLALWRKASQPLTTEAMAMLALAFVFGSTRRRSAGFRITMGVFTGIVLYFFDQITMHVGLLAGIRPAIVAFIPFSVISSLAFLRLRQVG